jgi:hypothetical protein
VSDNDTSEKRVKPRNLKSAALLFSYECFRDFVNAERAESNQRPLADTEMVVAYASCHEFWNKRKQGILIARLRRLL